MRQIVRIDTDAVSAHESGPEMQKIPFRSSCFQHLGGVDADLVKNEGKFIDERDIEISLSVLDYLCRFGDFDAAGSMDAGSDDASVDLCHPVEGCGCIAGHDFGNTGQRMLFV